MTANDIEDIIKQITDSYPGKRSIKESLEETLDKEGGSDLSSMELFHMFHAAYNIKDNELQSAIVSKMYERVDLSELAKLFVGGLARFGERLEENQKKVEEEVQHGKD